MQIDILDRMRKEKKNLKKKLRSPLNLGEIVYILLARIKKKDALSIFYKSNTDKKNFFNKNKKFVGTHSFENRNFSPSKIMSIKVKLIVQNDLEVNEEEGSFTLELTTEHPQRRGHLFLSREDEFMINSFRVNIDTNDINHTTYNKDLEVNLTQGKSNTSKKIMK